MGFAGGMVVLSRKLTTASEPISSRATTVTAKELDENDGFSVFEVPGDDHESQLQSGGGLFEPNGSLATSSAFALAYLDQVRLPPRCFIAPERPEHGAQQSPLDHKRHRHATNKRRTDYHRIHCLERT